MFYKKQQNALKPANLISNQYKIMLLITFANWYTICEHCWWGLAPSFDMFLDPNRKARHDY
jgi:hypothetical protein